MVHCTVYMREQSRTVQYEVDGGRGIVRFNVHSLNSTVLLTNFVPTAKSSR